MILILSLIALVLIKYLDYQFIQGLSWWWVVGYAVLIFLWFEFFERMLGLDKRKDDQHFEKMKKERLKRSFETPNNKQNKNKLSTVFLCP